MNDTKAAIYTGTTPFRQWRERLGLNQRQAAEKLGLRHVSAHYYDSGVRRPRPGTLLLMDAISRGIPLKPWKPE
jgi:hypothetical protein